MSEKISEAQDALETAGALLQCIKMAADSLRDNEDSAALQACANAILGKISDAIAFLDKAKGGPANE